MTVLGFMIGVVLTYLVLVIALHLNDWYGVHRGCDC